MLNGFKLLKAGGLRSCLRAQLTDLAHPVIGQRGVGQILERFTKEPPREIVILAEARATSLVTMQLDQGFS